jgi:hypothetical protein
MTLFQDSTLFQEKLFDFNPNIFFEQKKNRKLKSMQFQKNNILLNLIELNLVLEYFNFYGLNDVKQVAQKTMNK